MCVKSKYCGLLISKVHCSLKYRIEKSNLCDFKLKPEQKKQLETITRNFPKDIITERINSLNLINKINASINQG